MTVFYVLLIPFLLSSLILLGLVLLRKGEGGGLSGAFAGIGGEATFGVKAAKQLDKIIAWMAFVFLLLAVFLSHPSIRHGAAEEEGEESEEAPAESDESE